MDEGLVFNAKVISGIVEHVDELLRIDVDQIQALIDRKPERRSALAGVRHRGMPQPFAFIGFRTIAKQL
jgi:hypothetical protein